MRIQDSRVAQEGRRAFPGAFGGNLTLERIDLGALLPGDRLEIGAGGLLLELTDPTAPCRNQTHWFRDGDYSRISPKRFPSDARWYARVLAEGAVRPGDAIRVERTSEPGTGGAGHRWSRAPVRRAAREARPSRRLVGGHLPGQRAGATSRGDPPGRPGPPPGLAAGPSPAAGDHAQMTKDRETTGPLPSTRAELLALHAEARRRRNAAEWGSEEHRAAVTEVGRLEVEIARVERGETPPRV